MQCFFGTADFFRQNTFFIPTQNICRRCFLPMFDEGTQKIIVVGINQRVTTVADGLAVREFGTGTDVENSLRDDFATENFLVEVVA